MKKTAIFYFSYSGNTQIVAQKLQALTQGDLFEVTSKHTYPQDYNACINQAKKELQSQFRPVLTHVVPDLASYELILFGFPNWWGTYPMPMASLMDELKFSGQNVAVFCTHEGNGLGQSARDMEKACVNAKSFLSIAIRGSSVDRCDEQLKTWIDKLV